MQNVRNVIVLGSGPAGLTAAIYLSRAQLEPLVLEGEPSSTSDQPGGQLMLTTEVENYPGFPDGVMGPDLISMMRKQAERFGSEFLSTKAQKLEILPTGFKLTTSDQDEFDARAVVIATGARSLLLGVPGEEKLLGHGVSTCATCDGYFFRNQNIAVIGGGDSAMEEAIFLTKFANSVTIIHRRNELRASKYMQTKAEQNPKIKWILNSVVKEIKGENSVSSLVIENLISGEINEVPFEGVFVAIGHQPNTEIFRDLIEMDEKGYILTREGTKSSVDGIFACGDVQDHVYRQAITAAGSGCMAALDVERYLNH